MLCVAKHILIDERVRCLQKSWSYDKPYLYGANSIRDVHWLLLINKKVSFVCFDFSRTSVQVGAEFHVWAWELKLLCFWDILFSAENVELFLRFVTKSYATVPH